MLRLVIRPSQVWKRLGSPAAPADPAARGDFDEAYGRACAAVEPRYATARRRVVERDRGGAEFEGGVRFESADLAKLMEGAAAAYFLAVTVGEGLDDLAREYAGRGEIFRMTVADAVGSVAAEGLAARVHADLKADAAEIGELISRRISPGYADFGLENQPRLLDIAGGYALGISLTDNFMMVPRKSVTAVAAVKTR
jgi:hypothetical protein